MHNKNIDSQGSLVSKEKMTRGDIYHKMVDEVEDYAIILLDAEGYIQNWNKGAQKIKG